MNRNWNNALTADLYKTYVLFFGRQILLLGEH